MPKKNGTDAKATQGAAGLSNLKKILEGLGFRFDRFIVDGDRNGLSTRVEEFKKVFADLRACIDKYKENAEKSRKGQPVSEALVRLKGKYGKKGEKAETLEQQLKVVAEQYKTYLPQESIGQSVVKRLSGNRREQDAPANCLYDEARQLLKLKLQDLQASDKVPERTEDINRYEEAKAKIASALETISEASVSQATVQKAAPALENVSQSVVSVQQEFEQVDYNSAEYPNQVLAEQREAQANRQLEKQREEDRQAAKKAEEERTQENAVAYYAMQQEQQRRERAQAKLMAERAAKVAAMATAAAVATKTGLQQPGNRAVKKLIPLAALTASVVGIAALKAQIVPFTNGNGMQAGASATIAPVLRGPRMG